MIHTTYSRQTQLFIEAVKRGEVPEFPPGSSWGDSLARNEVTSRGMWAIVDKIWPGHLARWIGRYSSCLEIMAGTGWLSRALFDYDVDIRPTDDYSWPYPEEYYVSRVEKWDAVAAVHRYWNVSDILIVSWPPYGRSEVCRACEAWGSERPIVYIGEDYGGCNAPDEFWQHFHVDESAPKIEIPQWDGLHDRLMIGYYE